MDAEPMTNEELDWMATEARKYFACTEHPSGAITIDAKDEYLPLIAQAREANALRSEIANYGKSLDDFRHDNEALRARVAELEADAAAVVHAARMPADYEHGLPAWVNYMYITWQGLLAPDGRPIAALRILRR
ncbi:MAG: hypothetical protein FJ279_02105 [Planctomycetes bacterium]|nr:hypothetical protein [Planctomycetota bacterium]